MISITLESASNGIIKRIKDDNHNGSGLQFGLTRIYEIDRDEEISAIQSMNFLQDLIRDLALDMGNERGREVLMLSTDWGDHYTPSAKEINERIANLREQILKLKELKALVVQASKK